MSNSLTIKGLVNNFDPELLKRSVEMFGPCKVEINQNTAHVTYLSEESVIKAVPSLQSTNLLGAHPTPVEISTQNPKMQLWNQFVQKTNISNPQLSETNGKSSPNFGGNSKVVANYSKIIIRQTIPYIEMRILILIS